MLLVPSTSRTTRPQWSPTTSTCRTRHLDILLSTFQAVPCRPFDITQVVTLAQISTPDMDDDWEVLEWQEFRERIPRSVGKRITTEWQHALDSVPSHPKSKTASKLNKKYIDDLGFHYSTSPITKGRQFANVDTVPDYIPMHCPAIMYIALVNSYGTGNENLLDRSTPEPDHPLSAEREYKLHNNRVVTIMTAMASYHCIEGHAKPRPGPEHGQKLRKEYSRIVKTDQRFRKTDFECIIKDQDFRNALANTIRQVKGKELHWGLDPLSRRPAPQVQDTVPKASPTDHNAPESTVDRQDLDKDGPAHKKRLVQTTLVNSRVPKRSRFGKEKVVPQETADFIMISSYSDVEDSQAGTLASPVDIDGSSKPTPPHYTTVDALITHQHHTIVAVNARQVYVEAAMEGLWRLAEVTINRDRKMSPTSLLSQSPPDSELQDSVMQIYASIPEEILKALILGNLAKAKVENPTVKRMIDRMYEMAKAKNRPAIYNQALVDDNSDSPDANTLHDVISLMRLYVSTDVSDADAKTIFAIDQTLSRQKLPWTLADLGSNFLRYGLHAESPRPGHWGKPSQDRSHVILLYCAQLEESLRKLDRNALSDPVAHALSYTGYSTDISRRFGKHKNFTSQAYVMSIMRAVIEGLHPGQYRLDQSVVMLPWAKGQAPLAECIISRLTESYIAQGTGFNVRPGTSTADAENSDERWDKWFEDAAPTITAQYQFHWSPFGKPHS